MTDSDTIEFTDVVERVKAALAGAASSTGATFLPTETAEEIIELVYEKLHAKSSPCHAYEPKNRKGSKVNR